MMHLIVLLCLCWNLSFTVFFYKTYESGDAYRLILPFNIIGTFLLFCVFYNSYWVIKIDFPILVR